MDLDRLWGHISLDTMNVYGNTGWDSHQVNLLVVSSLIAANTSSYNCICSYYQLKSKMSVSPRKLVE